MPEIVDNRSAAVLENKLWVMVWFSRLAAWLDLMPVGVDGQSGCPALDLRQRHRSEVPYVDSDVDAFPGSLPMLMNIAEEMQADAPRFRKGDHRIVTEKQPPLFGTHKHGLPILA